MGVLIFMMKPKCSTRNNLKILLCSALFCVTSVIMPCFSAFAAPAVVPVTAEAILALLVALGLAELNPADNNYYWKGSDNPYVDSIFEEQAGIVISGDKIPIASESANKIAENVIAKDTYTTDGEKFYLGSKEVSVGDLYLQAVAVAETKYSMPTNITGILPSDGVRNWNGKTYWSRCSFDFEAGTDEYYFPYMVTENNAWILPTAINILTNPPGKAGTAFCYNFNTETAKTVSNVPYGKYIFYDYLPTDSGTFSMSTTSSDDPYYTTYVVGEWKAPVSPFLVSGTGSPVQSSVIQSCLLQTSGRPALGVKGDIEKLKDVVIDVDYTEIPPEPPSEDPDNKGQPPVPIPPDNWEIWRTSSELLDFINDGIVTNGRTKLGQYVNNNYNYVQVDVNVPDEINTNVNLGGNIGIDGRGDINVTVHEDVSLPSGGDGSGFFNPDAADVVDAVGKSNPVASVISGIFSAIDPKLLAVFSVSVSLMFVLGLWKLIRG